MSLFHRMTGKTIPHNTLIMPLQYLLFGNRHHGVLFANVEKDIGKGASKRVEQAVVTEMIGRIPLAEVTSLKGKNIVVYRPRDDVQSFINDIISIVKLGQMHIKEYNAKANIVKLKGHSLYVIKDYEGMESDYTRLLYEGYLKLSADPMTLLDILKTSLANETPRQILEQITGELLEENELVDSPFMICDVLPFSVYEAFKSMDPGALFQNVYQMVYTLSAYASEGVYFRDLQPDNFRVSQNNHVKLIDPSYIDKGVRPESRYHLFVKQTTPEYLPNMSFFSNFENGQQILASYFGHFTEGICIGMLERVLKRIFLPHYMGEKYDNLFLLSDPKNRIQTANTLKYQEDFDLFKDVVEGTPTPAHFEQYQKTLCSLMEREGTKPNLVAPLSAVITLLRKFSFPVFTETGCHSLLLNEYGQPMTISELPHAVESVLNIVPLSQQSTSKIYALPHAEIKSMPKKTMQEFSLSARGITIPPPVSNPIAEATFPFASKMTFPSNIIQETKKRFVDPPANAPVLPPISPPTQPLETLGEKEDPELEKEKTKKRFVNRETIGKAEQESSSTGENDPLLPLSRKFRGDLWRSAMDAATKKESPPSSAPEVASSQNKTKEIDERLRKNCEPSVVEVQKWMEEKMIGIKRLLEEHTMLRNKLEQALYEKISSGVTVEQAKFFFTHANNLLQRQETEFGLLKEAQALVPFQIHLRLEQVAPMEDKRYFSSTLSQRCKKIVSRYLVRIVKSRFILEMDREKKMTDFFPKADEDILHYILQSDLKYCFTSLKEMASVMAREVSQTEWRM